jgi:hypothetical protein
VNARQSIVYSEHMPRIQILFSCHDSLPPPPVHWPGPVGVSETLGGLCVSGHAVDLCLTEYLL